MAISGSQPAQLMAQSGVMRSGTSRSNVTTPRVFIAIAGVQVATARAVDANKALAETLTITETEGATPNTAGFTVQGFQPTDGQDVVMTLGSINNLDRLFAGTILTDAHGYLGTPANGNDVVSVIDYTWQLTRETMSAQWIGVSATVIAQAILAHAGRGFTSLLVQAGLPIVPVFTIVNQTHADALAALAKAIGASGKATYTKDYRFGITSDPSQTDPTVLTAASGPLTGLDAFLATRDLSQVITRQPVEGAGAQALIAVPIGATRLPIATGVWANPAGGVVAVGAQRVTYTGVAPYFRQGSLPAWVSQTPPSGAWQGIAWAPTLGIFVAVGPSVVATSPDGVTWTSQTPASASSWNSVAWAPALNLFTAVATTGQVMTSPDGVTWTTRTPAGTAEAWTRICWSPAKALFVVVGTKTTTYAVMTSPDGITWTGRTAAVTTAAWAHVVWAATPGLFVAYSTSIANAIMTSPDGITWTQQTGPNSGNALAYSPTLNLFVALEGTATDTSPDGLTWTHHAAAMPSATWNACVWSDAGYFIAASFAASGTNVAISTDGITWQLLSSGVFSNWNDLVWAPEIGALVGVGSTGTFRAMTAAFPIYATLTGIPASGAGSILIPINVGDAAALRVVIDDLAAQAALATLMGGTDDGVIEGPVIQGDFSEAEARAEGAAQLALKSLLAVSCTYTTRDKNTRAGRTIGVNLAAPTSVVGSFLLQQVTLASFQPAILPTRTVAASSARYTFEDLLRQLGG